MALIPPRHLLQQLRADLRAARLNYVNIVTAILLIEEDERRRRGRVPRRRRFWVRPWILRRPVLGHYDTLMNELMREAQGDFKGYMRMDPGMFLGLCQRMHNRLDKSHSARAPLEPGLKLAVTLRYMATGNSYRSLAFEFRVPHNSIAKFVPEVCRELVAELKDEVFTTPNDPASWRVVEEKFRKRWNLPHCCGAIDGKHIRIRKPKQSGTHFFNYKGYFSIVLLALVDGNYKFLWADVGAPGSNSDAGIFNEGDLRPALEDNTIGFPDPAPLPNDDMDTSYYVVGDDAFPLRKWMMKPFSHRYLSREERICNYQFSRGRRVSENAFGILATRWRCLLHCMHHGVEQCIDITMACLCMHNWMRDHAPQLQNADLDVRQPDGHFVPGAWRGVGVMADIDQVERGPRANNEGKQMRLYLKHYLNSEAGSVPWQDAAIDA